MQLWLYGNNLEILEENLFEFNPNLELIELGSNKIAHIDPKVFDNLIKLKSLNLVSNKCIDMFAHDPIKFQNVIRTVQLQCTNLDYSNLEQKVKYLEMESRILNSENLNKKFENLENEIKNSHFSNFFQEKLQGLNAAVIMRETVSKINNKLVLQDIKISVIEEKLEHIIDAITMINQNYEKFNNKFSNLVMAMKYHRCCLNNEHPDQITTKYSSTYILSNLYATAVFPLLPNI